MSESRGREGRGRSRQGSARACSFCGNRFAPRAGNQQYCSNRCKERAKGIRRTKTGQINLAQRRCVWCGNRIDPKKRRHAIYCDDRCRREAFKSRPCMYCGLLADTRDHVIPQSYMKMVQDFSMSQIVPACRECNSTAGSKVFDSISKKRAYIKHQYREKYKKLLESPDWTETELEELSPQLRLYIASSLEAKRLVRLRLRWPQN